MALSLGGSICDAADPVGRLLFKVLGMVAEFEADLIRMRTREGMAIAKATRKFCGKQPKLTAAKRRHLLTTHAAGTHTQTELAELFDVSRATVYRELQRAQPPKTAILRRENQLLSAAAHTDLETCWPWCLMDGRSRP